MNTRLRTGLFGGTFDPIHIGHLIMAENAMMQLGLDKVVFAPAANPPHKPHARLSEVDDRIRMIDLAIADRPDFVSSRIDADLNGPSFTWQLLERFQTLEPDADIVFIMGGDSLRDFHTWARPERILELAEIAVVERPGYPFADISLQTVTGLAHRIQLVETPICAISSTEIRERAGLGQTIRYLVPDAVRDLIQSQSFYRAWTTER